MSTDTPTSGLAGLGQSMQQHFPNVIDGIYGTFSTPAGSVCYMQTKAKIGDGSSKHAQLTRSLVPAREALNIQEMDFNQLLQRDLDDHRIATKLIPYILDPPANALPGFFPPIVAVLLPFDYDQKPRENFDAPTATLEMDHQYNGHFRMTTHGRAYRIQYLANDQGDLLDPPIAVLRWNPAEAKLVIMDGQHRAMSLLAIERTISNSWHTAPKGARYQPFYEEHVQRWLRKARDDGNPVDLSNIELPVTICWFPDEPGQDPRPRPHRAARKLFVDVNNTAKPPSEARLVLLSDTELRNIFARELLNRLRDEQAGWKQRFPLSGVEYDNPTANMNTPRRWSVLTNLEILRASVERVVFGPPKLIEQPTASLQGKPPKRDMNRFMRQRLEVGKLYPKQFHDGPHRLLRDEIADDKFPINDDAEHQKLLDAFYDRWGRGILWLLSEVLPYRAHLTALQQRWQDWRVASEIQTLAKSALYEDPSMYRALQAAHAYWQSTNHAADFGSTSARPAAIEAWHLLEQRERPAFCRERARRYLGSDSAESVKETNTVLNRLTTAPAQIGLMLTWTYLVDLAGDDHQPVEIAKIAARAINASLFSTGSNRIDRRRSVLSLAPSSQADKNDRTASDSESAIDIFFGYWLSLAINEETLPLWEEASISPQRLRGECWPNCA